MGLYNEHTVKVLIYLNHVYTVVLICVTSCHVCLDLSGNTKIGPIGTKVLWGSFLNYLRGLEGGGEDADRYFYTKYDGRCKYRAINNYGLNFS